MSDQEREKRKYKHTKQLVKIALESGLTAKQIAKKAGLSERSTAQVSRWKNGEALATERQMRSLIKDFGSQLKQSLQHILIKLDSEGEITYVQFEGDVVFEHKSKVLDNKVLRSFRKIALYQVEGKFVLAEMRRLGMENMTHSQLSRAWDQAHPADCEEANWIVERINNFSDAQSLLAAIDHYSINMIKQLDKEADYYKNENIAFWVHERAVIGFKARQALVKLGGYYAGTKPIDLLLDNVQNTSTPQENVGTADEVR